MSRKKTKKKTYTVKILVGFGNLNATTRFKNAGKQLDNIVPEMEKHPKIWQFA